MSSFGALLCTRADTRLSNLRSLPSYSRSPTAGLRAFPHHFWFSSASSAPAQHASSESTPSADNVETLPSQSTSEPTSAYYLRLRQLADEVVRDAKDLGVLHSQVNHLRKRLRSTQLLLEGGPWSVTKHWNLTPPPGDEVKLENDYFRVGSQKVPNIWLRDNCQCSSCMHQETKQRLLDTFSIPEDISIKKCAELRTYMDVTWSDGHHSRYDKDFLREAGADSRKKATVRQGHFASIELWGNEIANNKPQSTWRMPGRGAGGSEHSKTDDDMILHVLHKIARLGFCYITEVHPTPEATEALLKRIAFIRETHYGGFYDFTADLAKADTAYTNIALGAHTDNTYFTDPAGLQAFHLLSHTDGEGGTSLLVDGFKAAEDLLKEDKAAYNLLATVNVHAHASGNDGISIQPYRGFPVLEHDVETGALLRVRWNVADRSSIELPLSEVGKWYAAARKFDAILKRKQNEYWEQLKPGTVLVFDNWRVLHGRSSFTGKRRICGGYINRDDWISRFKMLHFGKQTVLGKLASG